MVAFGDAGCAAMPAGAALWAAAASATATAGKMEGMFSGRGLGLGCCGGPAVTWRPGGQIRSAALGERGAGLQSAPSRFDWAGLLQCLRLCGLVSAGENSSCGLDTGVGGVRPGVLGVYMCGVCVRITARGGCAVGRGLFTAGVWVAWCGGS